MGGLPPGPSASPLRQAAEWVRRPLPLLEECGRRYGETFTLRLAGLPPMVMITRPGTVREVFTGDPEVLRSGEANALLSAGLGKRSLLVLDGADHLRERRLMLPPFHGERMRQYGDLIRAIAEREIATWPAGAELALAPRMRTIALEVIVRAVFGVEGRERVERLQRALGRLLDSSSRPHRVLALLLIAPDGWTVRTWRRHAPTIRRVDALLLEEIRLRRADPCAAERPDILSLLLAARYEDRAPMGDAHLRDELMTLLVAGHETTAVALTWALERLARHPAAAERLASEVTAGTDEYLDAVVKETLRVRTVIPFVVRHLAAPLELEGSELPAGVRVAPCAHLVHRRPDLYPRPEAFRPERFLERPAGTYTWIPFGGGTRRCIGATLATYEMKTVLAAVARRGRVRTIEDSGEAVRRRGFALVPARDGRVTWERASPAPGAA